MTHLMTMSMILTALFALISLIFGTLAFLSWRGGGFDVYKDFDKEDEWDEDGDDDDENAEGDEQETPSIAALTQTGNLDWLTRWEYRSFFAGVRWVRGHAFLFLLAGGAVASALTAAGHPWVAVGAFLGIAAIPFLWVDFRLAMRARAATWYAKMERQLPEALMIMAEVTKAGGTFMEAVDAVASRMPDPTREVFRRIHRRMRRQVPAHEAIFPEIQRTGRGELWNLGMIVLMGSMMNKDLSENFENMSRSMARRFASDATD